MPLIRSFRSLRYRLVLAGSISLALTLLAATAIASDGTTVAGGNGAGSAANQLDNPYAVAVDGDGNLYVADRSNNRIQKFAAGSTSGTTVAGGNGAGSAANQLSAPEDVAVDGDGNIYVADRVNHRVQYFPAGSTSSTNGTTVAGGNGVGSAANQLYSPSGVALDGSDNLYVSDSGNDRVQYFPAGSTSSTNGTTVAGGNGYGFDANDLTWPYGLIVDGDGNLYVADSQTDRVQRFPAGSTSSTNADTVAGGNGGGADADQLDVPLGVALDAAGDLYVADLINHRIQKFVADSDGDGVPDGEDNCPDSRNASQADKDNDGIGNKCDDDLDGDNVDNEIDNCPNNKNAGQADKDNDGIGNKCDDDLDGDGIDNETDNCPTQGNSSQADKDGDGIGNKCDDDLDGDGVPNATDNCPNKKNGSQADKDGDGIGNKCDPD